MNDKIRTSTVAREIAAEHRILPQLALNLVTALKRELEITELWLSPKQASEIKFLIAHDLSN